MDIYMKKDFLQITGSFKERGARNALLQLNDEQKHIGVISASLGNHALALCYHGKELQISVTVVMPVVAPIMKITACRQYGANVIVDGNDMGEAKKIALTQAKEKGLIYINGYVNSTSKRASNSVYLTNTLYIDKEIFFTNFLALFLTAINSV